MLLTVLHWKMCPIFPTWKDYRSWTLQTVRRWWIFGGLNAWSHWQGYTCGCKAFSSMVKSRLSKVLSLSLSGWHELGFTHPHPRVLKIQPQSPPYAYKQRCLSESLLAKPWVFNNPLIIWIYYLHFGPSFCNVSPKILGGCQCNPWFFLH